MVLDSQAITTVLLSDKQKDVWLQLHFLPALCPGDTDIASLVVSLVTLSYLNIAGEINNILDLDY